MWERRFGARVDRMKLEQGQIWQNGGVFYRIVKWARLAIEYKEIKDPASKAGTMHAVTKKEFCRLIKGGTLLTAEQWRDLAGASAEA